MEESLLCAVIISLAIFFNFVAYNAIFNLTTNYNFDDQTDFICQIVFYSVFCICSIAITPVLLLRLHPKSTMLVAWIAFFFYILSSVVYSRPLLFISSFMLGFGCSFLWIASQQIMMRCANLYEIAYQLPRNATIGKFEGILLCGYHLSYCVGNLFPTFLIYDYYYLINPISIYLLLCCVSLLTPVILLRLQHKIVTQVSPEITTYKILTPGGIFIDPIHDDSTVNTPPIIGYNTFTPPQHHAQPQVAQFHPAQQIDLYSVQPIDDEMETDQVFKFHTVQSSSTLNQNVRAEDERKRCDFRTCRYKRWLRSVLLWRDARLQCIILLSLYWGFWLHFIWYELPQTIQSKTDRIQILMLIGFVDGILSLVVGIASDYIHRSYLICMSLLMQLLIYWLFFEYSWQLRDSLSFYCVLAMLVGASDAIFTTSVFSLYPLFMDPDIIGTFSNCYFWQSLGLMLSFLIRFIGFGQHDKRTKMIAYYMSLFLCCIPFFVSKLAAKYARSKYDVHESQYLNQRMAVSPSFSY